MSAPVTSVSFASTRLAGRVAELGLLGQLPSCESRRTQQPSSAPVAETYKAIEGDCDNGRSARRTGSRLLEPVPRERDSYLHGGSFGVGGLRQRLSEAVAHILGT